MQIRVKKLLILAILLFSLTLTSCSVKPPAPHTVLTELVGDNLGAGTVYSTHVAEGGAGYITPELCKALFTENIAVPKEMALYLRPGLDGGCEVFVLSTAGAEREELVALLLDRLSLLKGYYGGTGAVFFTRGLVIWCYSTDFNEFKRIKDVIE